MSSYKGIIFDLDGVLCHTDEYHYLAWKALADKIGVPFDRQVNERLRGVSRMESLDIILERATRPYTAAEKAALATEKNEMYRGFLANMTPDDLPAGVGETLATLRARGYRLAIGSSSRNTPLIRSGSESSRRLTPSRTGTRLRIPSPTPRSSSSRRRSWGSPPPTALSSRTPRAASAPPSPAVLPPRASAPRRTTRA